jgi:Carboxypeptidase regulatory-like domain
MRPMSGHGRSVGHWTLAVLLACLALLATIPAIAAAATVAGKVTNAKGEGIGNVEVRYYSSEDEYEKFVTESNGEYGKDINAEAGVFKVEFVPPAGSGYVSQYYKEKLSFAAATPVTVEEGKTTSISAVLAKGASISGTVTSAALPHSEIGHIEVTAYEKAAPNAVIGHTETNKFGVYALAGLFKGAYVIGFKVGPESGLDYAPQFFPEKQRFLEAGEVSVTEGKEEPGINAKLVQGGSISGTVTDAATSQPLSGITVIATAPGGSETLEARTSTDVNGGYTLEGLGSGSVDVVFQQLTEGKVKPGEVRYLSQFYKEDDFPEHISSPEELFIGAVPVEVTIPNTTSGIDAAMVRVEPANKVAPVVSGAPAVGQTLACSNGSWTGLGTLAYAYKWLRNGSVIAGANSNTYAVQGADQGDGLACAVTATNEIEAEVTRSVSATSNTVTVPLPLVTSPPAPPRPTVTVSSSKLVASGGTVRVPVACAGADCSGTVELIEQQVTKTRKGKRTIIKKKVVPLGKATYSLAAGHSATISIHLTANGKGVLAKAKRHQLAVEVIASVAGGAATKKSVVLSELTSVRGKGKRK